jgi:anti-sigma B factor antagonist
MTSFSEKMLQNAYEKLSDDKVRKICLNFSDVSYINSAGMAIIIGILTKTRQREQTLCAYGLSEHFQKIFGMVGVTKYVTHYESEAEAVASFG